MHTITLKSDDTFYDMVNDMVKELGISKSELIRRSIAHYRESLNEQRLRERMRAASLKVRNHSLKINREFDETLSDGLA